jgi:hypothetical protein
MWLLLPIGAANSEPPTPVTFRALLDTGAQCTCIAPNLVAMLGLSSVGVGSLIPANGEPVDADRYVLNMAVPVAIQDAGVYGAGKTLHVMELHLSACTL